VKQASRRLGGGSYSNQTKVSTSLTMADYIRWVPPARRGTVAKQQASHRLWQDLHAQQGEAVERPAAQKASATYVNSGRTCWKYSTLR
jgi:hypothetical protein